MIRNVGMFYRIKGFVKLEESAAAVTKNEKMNSSSAQKTSTDNIWLELKRHPQRIFPEAHFHRPGSRDRDRGEYE